MEDITPKAIDEPSNPPEAFASRTYFYVGGRYETGNEHDSYSEVSISGDATTDVHGNLIRTDEAAY